MADQGKTLITMTVPDTAVRGTIVSGAGAFSASALPAGVVYDDADGETSGAVQIAGTALVKLGGTVSAGDAIVSDASGLGVSGTLGTDFNILGVALEGGDANELRRVAVK